MSNWINRPTFDEITDKDREMRKRAEQARDILTYKVWFDYERALEIFGHLDTVYLAAQKVWENPVELGEIRQLAPFIYGEINTGKTTLVLRYKTICQKLTEEAGTDWNSDNIFYYETPPRVSCKRMLSALSEKLGGFAPKGSVLRNIHTDVLIDAIIKQLEFKKVKLLIIDELQNLTRAKLDDKQDIFDSFKKLLNQSPSRIVLVGTTDARDLFQLSKWIEERVTPFKLPTWKDGTEFRDVLRSLYDTYSPALPEWDLITFDASNKTIFDYPTVQLLERLSEGRLGKLIQLIQYAAVRALLHNRATILKEDYEYVFSKEYAVKNGKVVEKTVEEKKES